MNLTRRSFFSILLTGIWINISEFVRNELLLKSYWVEHYQNLGMVFPSQPVNGVVWMIWGFFYAISIFIISRKFDLVQTTLLSWFVAFVLMWIVIWNLNVLPNGILYFAVPLGFLEAFVGAYICKRMSSESNQDK